LDETIPTLPCGLLRAKGTIGEVFDNAMYNVTINSHIIFARAIWEEQMKYVGKLLNAGYSTQDDFDTSCKELETMEEKNKTTMNKSLDKRICKSKH
jgi:hypothetical protein